MAYITDTNAARGDSALGGVFSRLGARWRAWRSYRATLSALSQLSEAELADIGLTRDDIHRVSRRAL